MRILGIDPGYDRLGIAVLDKPARGKEILLHSECFETSSKDAIHDRLFAVGSRVAGVLDEFKPDVMSIETLFMDKNQKTGMRVAEARGIIIYEAVKRGVGVHEYSPLQIKMAVTGDGRSDKARIIKMVRLLVKMADRKARDDEYDAVAVALAHSAMAK